MGKFGELKKIIAVNTFKVLNQATVNLGKTITKNKDEKRYKKYFYINDNSSITLANDKLSYEDDYRYSVGNYFKTSKNAENFKEKLLIEKKLKDIAMELNKSNEIDWNNPNQIKYYLNFSNHYNTVGQTYDYFNKIQGVIYCLNVDFRAIAKDRIGEERLNKYLKGELD